MYFRAPLFITSTAAMRAMVLCVSLVLPGPCLTLLLGALCSLKQLHCVAPCEARSCSDTCSVSLVLARYSTVQYSTVQHSTVQYSTVQYSTVQYSTGNNFVNIIFSGCHFAAAGLHILLLHASFLLLHGSVINLMREMKRWLS